MSKLYASFPRTLSSPNPLSLSARIVWWKVKEETNKVRPIDDCKASMVKFAVTQNEGVTIHTIDHIAAMIALWMERRAQQETGPWRQSAGIRRMLKN